MSHAVDFEFFDLSVHSLQEDAEVFRNLLVSNEMLGVFTGVEFGDQVSAGLVNGLDSFWEPLILFI